MRTIWIFLSMINLAIPEKNATENDITGLIANGDPYDRDTFQYVVYLLKQESPRKVFYCTGALITPVYVLTCAHCTDGFDKDTMKVSTVNT